MIEFVVMMTFFFEYRRVFLVLLQLGIVALSNYLAFWIRFDSDIPDNYSQIWSDTLLWLLVVRGFTFLPFRLYEGFWRYTGFWDLRNILLAVFLSTIFFAFTSTNLFDQPGYPRSIFIIDSLLLLFFL